MKDLVIIGAGGFGRTVYWQCDADYGNNRDWTIKGFLDDRPNVLDGFGIPKPILGTPFTYKADPNEIWLCALGEPKMRRTYAAPIVKQGVEFINLRTEVAGGCCSRTGRCGRPRARPDRRRHGRTSRRRSRSGTWSSR